MRFSREEMVAARKNNPFFRAHPPFLEYCNLCGVIHAKNDHVEFFVSQNFSYIGFVKHIGIRGGIYYEQGNIDQ